MGELKAQAFPLQTFQVNIFQKALRKSDLICLRAKFGPWTRNCQYPCYNPTLKLDPKTASNYQEKKMHIYFF